MNTTNVLSAKQIKREWHIIDAKNKILGRLAVEIAKKLTGKGKVNYVPYLDNGDFVVVTNASQIKLTGKKSQQKVYVHHSGYPGGLRVEPFAKLINRRPEEVIQHAVWGMVPKTKLGKGMVKRLKVFSAAANGLSKNIKQEEQ